MTLVNPNLASAQGPITNPALGTGLPGLSGSEFFSGLVSALITLLFVIGAIIFVFIFIIGATSWITSGGDKLANKNARKRITNAFVGLTILLSLFGVVNLIEAFFGTNLTSFNVADFSIPPTTPGPTAIPTIPYLDNCDSACRGAGHVSGHCYGGPGTCPGNEILITESCGNINLRCCCRLQPTTPTATPTPTPTPILPPGTTITNCSAYGITRVGIGTPTCGLVINLESAARIFFMFNPGSGAPFQNPSQDCELTDLFDLMGRPGWLAVCRPTIEQPSTYTAVFNNNNDCRIDVQYTIPSNHCPAPSP